MEAERKKDEDQAPFEASDLKKEALLIGSSLKKGWQYVLAYFTGQTMRMKARTEKEASEAELKKAKMQVEATDEAERRKNELNKRSEDYEFKEYVVPSARRFPLPPTTTSVHVTALDGLVTVNSLFTVAVFVGLSLTSPGQRSLEDNTACDAGPDVVRNLLVFEVVSFSFFLFSSLIAQGLKLAINLINSNDVDEAFRAHINARVLRLGMLGSAVGSVLGCLFLLLSMVNVIQIRLGMLSCGSSAAVRAVAVLLTLVCTALAVYISTIFYAFTH